MIIAVLGRQPALGLAELESLYGSEVILPIGTNLASINHHADINIFKRCGSVIKFAEILDYSGSGSLADIEKYIFATVNTNNNPDEPGKITLGVSDYTNKITTNELSRIGLTVKKSLKNTGFSVRIVPNKSSKLSTAQVIHNSLTKNRGYEFVIFKENGNLKLAKTIYEQEIEAYTARDQVRPKRDARVGMLPPKLAQTIINLATGQVTDIENRISDIEENRTTKYELRNTTVLDPFCGTGVVLQEALLMGYDVYGTDLEPRMIEFSKINLEWLQQNWNRAKNGNVILEVADATNYEWQNPINFIAAETYLGRPLSSLPDNNELTKLVQSVNTLHKKMLSNIARQIPSGTRICLAVPAWRAKNGFVHLPVLDQLSNMGYNQLVFSHAKASDLVYAREDQIVGRQLVVIVKK